MRKYIFDSDTGEWKSHASFDISTFSDIEVTQQGNEIIGSKLDPMWAFTVGGSIYNAPIISGGMIYFGCNDKKFYALSKEGRLVWDFETQGVIISSPCMTGNLLVFGSYDFNLYALTLEGRLAWKFPAKDKIFSNPCTDGSHIFFGSKDGNFYCVSKHGELVWSFRTGGPIETHPLFHEGVVYFGSNDHNLYALGAEKGNLLWKFPAKAEIRHGFAILNNVIYFGGMEKTIYGVNLQGKQVFSFVMNDLNAATIAADNGTLFIPSRDHYIYAVKPTGEITWKFKTGFSVERPVVHKRIVFFGSDDHNFYAVDAATGRLLWKFSGNGFMASTPVIHDGIVYMGGWDCNMYALNADSGRLIWKFRTSIGTQSTFDMDAMRPQKHFEVVWMPEEEDNPEEKKEGKELSEYSVGENVYASAIGSDYLGKKKRGYI